MTSGTSDAHHYQSLSHHAQAIDASENHDNVPYKTTKRHYWNGPEECGRGPETEVQLGVA